jgi:hypothetical protein
VKPPSGKYGRVLSRRGLSVIEETGAMFGAAAIALIS